MTTMTGAYGPAAGRSRWWRLRLAARLGRFAGRVVPTWPGVRRFVLVVGGLGCLDAAAWRVSIGLGLAAIGTGLLLLDWVTGE